MTCGLNAVALGHHEQLGAGVASPRELLANATDRPDAAVGLDRARSGNVATAGEIFGGEFVDDSRCEHQACAGPSHILQREVDVEIGREVNTDHRTDIRRSWAVGILFGRDLDLDQLAVAFDVEDEGRSDRFGLDRVDNI